MKLDKTKNYFVTAIGTDSGKSFVSTYLCETFGFNYWKPIQAGTEETDTNTLKSNLKRQDITFFPETYSLKTPMSPHEAAKIDGVTIDLEEFNLPKSEKGIIIEGAGGVLVPINDKETLSDLIKKLNVPVILVVNFYLGSINHTLLTISHLISQKIPIEGIIYNGTPTLSSVDIINKTYNIPVIGYTTQINSID